MSKFKSYRRKSRLYTRIDSTTEQVRIISKKEKILQEERKLKPAIDDTVAVGKKSDFVNTNWREGEFIIDFMRSKMQNDDKSKVSARIIFSPINAKRLYGTVVESIKNYESQYGPIK